jgi:hypothetical protein
VIPNGRARQRGLVSAGRRRSALKSVCPSGEQQAADIDDRPHSLSCAGPPPGHIGCSERDVHLSRSSHPASARCRDAEGAARLSRAVHEDVDPPGSAAARATAASTDGVLPYRRDGDHPPAARRDLSCRCSSVSGCGRGCTPSLASTPAMALPMPCRQSPAVLFAVGGPCAGFYVGQRSPVTAVTTVSRSGISCEERPGTARL